MPLYNPIPGPWTAYTPVWTNVTIGNAVVTAAFNQDGKQITTRTTVVVGTTTSVSGVITFSLPITSVSYPGTAGTQPLGFGIIFDTSAAAVYQMVPIWFSTTTARFNVFVSSGAFTTLANSDATNPVAPGTGDEWTWEMTYQAA